VPGVYVCLEKSIKNFIQDTTERNTRNLLRGVLSPIGDSDCFKKIFAKNFDKLKKLVS